MLALEAPQTPMAKQSAGIVLFRKTSASPEVLLVHPGGPFWRNKDLHAWSIPKGEVGAAESLLDAARREFAEEVGFAPQGDFLPLASVKQAGGKIVHAWAVEHDFDVSMLHSNTFQGEWPPRSGKLQDFPEVDRAGWFTLETAKTKAVMGQILFIERLAVVLSGAPAASDGFRPETKP